jgi:hypothetical protein
MPRLWRNIISLFTRSFFLKIEVSIYNIKLRFFILIYKIQICLGSINQTGYITKIQSLEDLEHVM